MEIAARHEALRHAAASFGHNRAGSGRTCRLRAPGSAFARTAVGPRPRSDVAEPAASLRSEPDRSRSVLVPDARRARRTQSLHSHTDRTDSVARQRRRLARRNAHRLSIAPRRALRRRKSVHVGRRRVHLPGDSRSRECRGGGHLRARRRADDAGPVHGRGPPAPALERGGPRPLRAGRFRLRHLTAPRVRGHESRGFGVGAARVRNRPLSRRRLAARRGDPAGTQSVLPSATAPAADHPANHPGSDRGIQRVTHGQRRCGGTESR